MKKLVTLLTAIAMMSTFAHNVQAYESDTKGHDEQAIIQARALGEIPPAAPRPAPQTNPTRLVNDAEEDLSRAPGANKISTGDTAAAPQQSAEPIAACNAYEDVRSVSYAMPAFAIGTIAIVAIIAVAVQNANSGHKH